MKIVAFMQAYNESDIIESVVRHTLTFADHLVLRDSDSLDQTRTIMDKLKEEALPLTVMGKAEHEDAVYNHNPKLPFWDSWRDIVFREMDADIYINVDADEFFFDLNGENPRYEMERLAKEDKTYTIFWRSYVYEQLPDDNSVFLPEYFTFYRDPSLDAYGKSLMTRNQWQQGMRMSVANHSLIYSNGQPVDRVETSLRCAHYALRSPAQTMLKIILDWMNTLERRILEEAPEFAHHWHMAYEEIQKNGFLNDEQVTQLSKTYSLFPKDIAPHIPCIYGPLSDFIETVPELKYTDYSTLSAEGPTYYNLLTKGLEQIIQQANNRYDDLKAKIGTTTHTTTPTPDTSKAPAGDPAVDKVGRNAPCPCGSGKKYKKCCGQ